MKKITNRMMKCLRGSHRVSMALALTIAVSAILWFAGASSPPLRAADIETGSFGYVPAIDITDPPDGAVVDSSTDEICGSITAGSVHSVELRIKRDFITQYWTGDSWVNDETWVELEPSDISGISPNFHYCYDCPGMFGGTHEYTVTARYTAVEGQGVTETSSPVTYYSTSPPPGVPGISLWGGVTLALLLATLIVWLVGRRPIRTEETH